MTVDEYFRFWNCFEAEADDPELPIRMANLVSPEAFHPSIFAALCSPDLRVAVGRIAQYKKLVGPMSLRIEESDEGLFAGCQWDDPDTQLPVSLAATELTRSRSNASRARLSWTAARATTA